MKRLKVTTLLFLLASAVQAQQRVFVSASHGDDANLCTVNAPCRSFARALTQVFTAGEILALDSGGFGPLTITRAVSVVAPRGVEASITQSAMSQNAINVNAPGAVVVLRGLSVFGLGGTDGIFANAVSALIVDSCTFAGFTTAGIEFTLSNPGTLSVDDSSFYQNGSEGIVTTGSASDTALFLIQHSRMENNGGRGLVILDGSRGTIFDSSLSHNTAGGIYAGTLAPGQTALLHVDHCVLSGNAVGIQAVTTGGTGLETVKVAASVIVHNTNTGVLSGDANAHLWSRSDNTLQDNATDGTFTDFFTTH